MRRLVLATTCALLSTLVMGCSAEPSGLPEDAVDYTQHVSMTLEVTGTAHTVDMRISLGGEVTEANDRAVPLTSDTGGPVTIDVALSSRVSAKATVGSDGGDITCRLLDEDGDVVDTGHASGAYASTTCEGWPPVPETTEP